jgi:hypothetical protein
MHYSLYIYLPAKDIPHFAIQESPNYFLIHQKGNMSLNLCISIDLVCNEPVELPTMLPCFHSLELFFLV